MPTKVTMYRDASGQTHDTYAEAMAAEAEDKLRTLLMSAMVYGGEPADNADAIMSQLRNGEALREAVNLFLAAHHKA